MAITITSELPRSERISRNILLNVLKVELTAESYATGGIPLDFTKYIRHNMMINAPAQNGYTFQYDETNKKLKIFNPTIAHTHTENTAAAYVQNAITSANTVGPGTEVENATSLTMIFKVALFGLE